MIPLSKPIQRTGNFVGRVRVLEPRTGIDGRCKVYRFPKFPRRDASLWRVKTCQWIDGDPRGHSHEPGLMCGCPVEDGKSYCAEHARRAYVATRAIVSLSRDERNGTKEFHEGIYAPGVSTDEAVVSARPGGAFDVEGICGE